MRVVIGSDAEGMPLKETIKQVLVEDGHKVVDLSEASPSTRTVWAAIWPLRA